MTKKIILFGFNYGVGPWIVLLLVLMYQIFSLVALSMFKDV